MELADAQKYADIIKNIATALGILATALYFAIKILGGYEVLNVKLAVRSKRESKPNSDRDYLAITATVTKGDRASVQLHDAQARITVNGLSHEIAFKGVERLSIKKIEEQSIYRHVVLWGLRSKKATFLNLTPGEESEFACITEVPKDQACIVEVVFLGQRPNSIRLGQWRASHASLPNTKKESAATDA